MSSPSRGPQALRQGSVGRRSMASLGHRHEAVWQGQRGPPEQGSALTAGGRVGRAGGVAWCGALQCEVEEGREVAAGCHVHSN